MGFRTGLRFSFAPPESLAQLCQKRWDTSPYRNVHKLTWNTLNKPRWPYNGSLAWEPTWGFQKPLPPGLVDPRDGGSYGLGIAPRQNPLLTTVSIDGSSTRNRGPELLHRQLASRLGLSAQDALALVQRSRVMVNGRLVRRDRWVDDTDEVSVNGHPLTFLENLAFIAHKPPRCALTEGDPLMRQTYISLLPHPLLVARPLGVVDFGSSGLLVLTNNPSLKRALRPDLYQANEDTQPPSSTFLVRLRRQLKPSQLASMATAVAYGPDAYAPELIEEVSEDEDVDDLELLEESEPMPSLLQLDSNSAYAHHIPRQQATSTLQLSAGSDSLEAQVSIAPWRRQEARLKDASRPLLKVVIPGGTAGMIRRALEFVGSPPALGICCLRLGPLSIEEPTLSAAGGLRPLSSDEITAVLSC